MSVREKSLVFWTLFVVLSLLAMIWLREILLPFVAGAALAYFLDPVADRLGRIGFSRFWATIVILICFSIAVFLLLVTILPFLIRELKEIVTDLPAYMENVRGFIAHYYQAWFGKELTEIELGFEAALRKFANSSSLKLGDFLRQLWDGSMAVVSMLSLLVVTPVVAFYLLVSG